METIIAYTAGGARVNPGPAAAGVYITNVSGEKIKEVKESLGNGTSNFAEYYGVMLALQTLKQMYGNKTKDRQFELRLANELVKKQLNNEYQINEPGLVPMFIGIHNLQVSDFPHLTFTHIQKEHNQEADRLVNETLDGK